MQINSNTATLRFFLSTGYAKQDRPGAFRARNGYRTSINHECGAGLVRPPSNLHWRITPDAPPRF